MKTFTLCGKIAHKKFLLLTFLSILSFQIFSQTSSVDVSVNWPNWSSENRAEIYNPGGTLLSTIDNGYDGCCDDNYSTTTSLGCVPDGNNYYIIMYDTYGDGWNGGASNITITSGGSNVLTNSGASAIQTGTTLFFNVSGGCTTSCSSTVSSFPYTESFESGIGQWIQATTDNFDWSRRSGITPSNNTGPNSANGGTWYMYTEASSNYNNTANLESPCFDLTSAISAQFSFYYHMFGSNMGTLNVDLSTNGITFPVNLWSQSGQVQTSNGASWNQVLLDLTPYIGQTIKLRFSGTTGSSYRSDMAIDDFSLTASTTPQPEIDIQGNALSISNGDSTPSTLDDTDFGSIPVVAGSNSNIFTITNNGTLNLNLTAGPQFVSISGTNPSDFTLTTIPASNISAGNSTTFTIVFDPSGNGLRSAIVTIANNDSNENPYTFYIQGYGVTPLTEGPGGVTTNLELWLKANDGAGVADNTPLSTWYDQANTNHATVNTPGQEPTYRDNASYNVNFNPVVDFDSSYSLSPLDSDFSYDDTNGDFLESSSGFYTQDIFAVVLPETNINSTFGNMDIFCGDEDISTNSQDVSGFGFGRYSVRFTNEVFAYCVGSSSSSSPYVGYGVADNGTGTNYNNVGILNARNHATLSQQELFYNANDVETVQNDLGDFSNVNNSRYWLGRSEGYEAATNAKIVEIISFSSRKNDTNLADERNKIQSYLAIKYGVTLGVNGVSQDYVASDTSLIWDVSTNSGYNYDIAGIGRDDNSDLYQKQSKSVNNGAIVAMALDNIELTNNLNTNTFATDNEFLVWGNDGQNTNSSATSINVNLGPATITTVTDVMNRKWKIVETVGDDVGKIEVSIFESDFSGLPALVGNDAYVMLVADDSGFTNNLKTVFLDPNTFNGLATREGSYDFDGTKYFTFGVAHESVQDRHLDFDGIDNYTLVGDKVDLGGSFTASSWIKTDGSNALGTDKTIVAKNNGTIGYKFFVTDANIVSFSVGTNAADRIDSNTTIPNNVWHHVAVSYDGTIARIYIDGVLDNTKTMTSPTPNGSDFAIGAIFIAKANVQDYFKGSIDEIRVWDAALTSDQLHYVMNQELELAGSVVNGKVVPNSITKNDIAVVNWTNLLAYYSMNSYIGTHLNDVSGNGNRGSLTEPNNFDLEFQSSPLPYRSTGNGNWDLNSTWLNGSEQYIPGSPSIVDPNITVDWNIVATSHDITMNNASLPVVNNDNRSVLALEVTANELTVDTDNGLTVTHYLKVDGFIDLLGESQLIQSQGSDLDVTSSGHLERDQQGTADLYTYNYWSSPVGLVNTSTNNTSFTMPNVFGDGTNPSAPAAINFIGGYDGANTNPISIADYWIYKFVNGPDDDYSSWQQVRSTGNVAPGEGFTLKGPGSGGISTPQNYVFDGKPNNGDISLNITAGNDYLVGNPYPSAIDAHEFLDDNPLTGGTLYFWEHWGGGSHLLGEYQGGYAQYNYSGGTGAASYGTNDPDVGTGGTPVKLPGQYIPVSQGFFVYGASTGTVNFENDQRAFVKEGGTSIFVRSASGTTDYSEDGRMKFRIGFNSFNEVHRQLLLTVDENATANVDWGYDGSINEQQIDDMYWMIQDEKYVIQGTNVVTQETVVPLGIHVRDDGINTITIDHLENVPQDVEIYVLDTEANTYKDLRAGDYDVFLTSGDHLDRFSIVFKTPTLGNDDYDLPDTFEVHYSNSEKSLVILNPTITGIDSIEIFNILGQSIQRFDDVPNKTNTQLKVNNLSTGAYIIKLNAEIGTISKKVLVK